MVALVPLPLVGHLCQPLLLHELDLVLLQGQQVPLQVLQVPLQVEQVGAGHLG